MVVEERASAGSGTTVRPGLKVGVVLDILGANITLDIVAPGLHTGHLVASILLDEWALALARRPSV